MITDAIAAAERISTTCYTCGCGKISLCQRLLIRKAVNLIPVFLGLLEGKHRESTMWQLV